MSFEYGVLLDGAVGERTTISLAEVLDPEVIQDVVTKVVFEYNTCPAGKPWSEPYFLNCFEINTW